MENVNTLPPWWRGKGGITGDGTMRYKPSGKIEWRFQVKVPGGSKQVSAYGHGFKELKRDRERIELRFAMAPERIRLNELLDRYLDYKRDEKQQDPRNVKMLAQKFASYIRPKLGRFSLAALCETRSIIKNVFKDYKKTHPNSRTMQITFDELRRAFKYAQREEWCNLNPMEHLERPSYHASEAVIFSTEHIHQLLDLAQGQDRMMLLTFIMTTLRPSELWGIKRRSLDLDKGVLTLETFVHTDEDGRKVEKANGQGKTKRSVRQIPLLPTLVQAFHFYLAGEPMGEDDYLFAAEDGGLLNDNNWRRHHFKPLVKAIGMERATPYDLRHSANTFLAENGVSTDIRASICGHSEEVNLRVYTHYGMQAKREALANLDALFKGAHKGQEQGQTTAVGAA